jgi:PAS domain S-box-containing protein
MSLRRVFVVFAAATVVYVAGFAAIIAIRVGPTARHLKDDSHTAMAVWAARNEVDSTLERSLDAAWLFVREAEFRRIRPGELAGVRGTLDRLEHSTWLERAMDALSDSPLTVRTTVRTAWDQESRAIGELHLAVEAIELGQRVAAADHMVRVDSLRHVAGRMLLQLEQPALVSTFRAGGDVLIELDSAYMFAIGWLAGGGLLIIVIAVFIQWRVYRPLAELDAGMGRLAAGALDVVVPVRHDDELGRVNGHFNQMTSVLRTWADHERRRADNLAERLGRVLEESSNEILVFDAETLHFRHVNAAARANTGFTAGQLGARTPADLLPDYEGGRLTELLRPLREGSAERVVVTTWIRRRDGTTYPVEMSVYLSTRDTPPAFIAIAQDVTQRYALEAERDRILDLSVDILLTVGADARLVRVSRAAFRVLGFQPDEMEGRPVPEFIHPDDVEELRAGFEGLHQGRPLRGLAVRVRHRDGGWRWISWNCDPPVDGVLYGVGRDVTDRRQAEARQAALRAALERSAREWTTTFDAIDDPIVLVGPAGSVIRLNDAARRLVGRRHADVIGQALATLGDDELWVRSAELAARVQVSGKAASSQVLSRRQGRTWAVDAQAVPGLEDRGAVVLVVAHDVSAVVQLQQSLRHSETMAQMGAVVAGVAHEVRNPLFSMSATLDAFEAKRGRIKECEPHFGVLREQLERLRHLMHDLLEYGKPPTLELASVDLTEVVRRAWESSPASPRRVTLIAELPEQLPAVRGDRLRLTQVLANLLTNAVQHSPDGGRVRVRAHNLQQDGRVWVECVISDEGEGFIPGDLPHVFEPFYTRRSGGTGLGLALVQRIVEQHGGSVEAENLDAGGAAVRVRLPMDH